MPARGRGRRVSRTVPVRTRSSSRNSRNANRSPERDMNLHVSEDEENNPGVSFDNPPNADPINQRPNQEEDQMNHEIERARRGLQEIQRSRESSASEASISAQQVQRMIDQSIATQTERLTEMFNRVLVDQLAVFRTPPHPFGFPTAQSRNTPKNLPIPPQFNDSNFENHIPRQSLAAGHFLNNNSNNNSNEQSLSGHTITQNTNNNVQNVPAVRFDSQRNIYFNNETNNQSSQQLNAQTSQNNSRTPQISQINFNTPICSNLPNSDTFPIVSGTVTTTQANSDPSNCNLNRSSINFQTTQNISNPQTNISQTHTPIPTFNNTQDSNFHFPKYPYMNPGNYPCNYPPQDRPFFSKRGLNDWDLKYDGTSSVERFIVKVDIIRKANNLPWSYVVSQFHCLIKKPADRWYWSWIYAKQRDGIVVTWEILKNALIGHFGSAKSDDDIMQLLTDLRHKPSEKFSVYFEEFMTIHDGLKEPKDDQRLINIMKRNISDRLYYLTYLIEAPNVDSFAAKVSRIEEDLDRRFPSITYAPQKFKYNRKINELNKDENEDIEEKEIDEFRLNNNNPRDKFKTRNFSSYKENKDIHCYKCGNPGFTVQTCPKCQNQENSVERGNAVGTTLSE